MSVDTLHSPERAREYLASGAWTPEDRLGSLLDERAARHPDREYVSFEGDRYTYAAFADWVNAIAADLAGRGVRKGDRILIQVPNRMEALALQLAAFRIGAVNVPVIPIYRSHELSFIIRDAQPAVIAVSALFSDRTPPAEIDAIIAGDAAAPKVKYVIGGEHPGWASPPAPGESRDAEIPAPADPDEPAIILYTSGTTADPKGAVLTSRECIAHARSWVGAYGVNEGDVYLVGNPLSHLGGFNAAILLPLFTGARVVVIPSWKPLYAAEVAEREGVTLMLGAALFLTEMVATYESGRFASRPIRLYASAGAATPADVIRRADAFGVRAGSVYGMTEAGTLSGFSAEDSLEMRATMDGRIFAGMEVQAVDEDRRRLPFGEAGELRVRGPQTMDRYTDPVVSARQIDADGWFYTGDVGYVTADGWLKMTGRLKDIINRGGEKFSAQDIEMAILSHPDVTEAAALGLPDERFGECVGAFVRLAEGVAWNGPEPLLAHLNTVGLAKQKLPVIWHLVPEGLPRTPSGKVKKNELAQYHERNAG